MVVLVDQTHWVGRLHLGARNVALKLVDEVHLWLWWRGQVASVQAHFAAVAPRDSRRILGIERIPLGLCHAQRAQFVAPLLHSDARAQRLFGAFGRVEPLLVEPVGHRAARIVSRSRLPAMCKVGVVARHQHFALHVFVQQHEASLHPQDKVAVVAHEPDARAVATPVVQNAPPAPHDAHLVLELGNVRQAWRGVKVGTRRLVFAAQFAQLPVEEAAVLVHAANANCIGLAVERARLEAVAPRAKGARLDDSDGAQRPVGSDAHGKHHLLDVADAIFVALAIVCVDVAAKRVLDHAGHDSVAVLGIRVVVGREARVGARL